MKRIFEIEFPDGVGFGPFWINVDNLTMCLRTKEFIGPKVEIAVRDITDMAYLPPSYDGPPLMHTRPASGGEDDAG